ncbi:MAG: NUDIX hydrolase [Pseudomonadota bacterium]
MVWKTLDREIVFDRQPFLRVVKERIETERGEVVDDFFQVELRSFAMTVPILENGKVQLIRQYKHGPRRVSLCFPGGFLDEGEAPIDCARRELLEETGLQAGELIPLGSFVDNGSQRGSISNYFLAPGCTQLRPPAPGDLEEFEYVEMRPDEVDRELATGGFAINHHVTAWSLVAALGHRAALDR